MKRIKLQVVDFQNINKHFVLYIYRLHYHLWRLHSRTWNQWTSPWMRQLMWLRIIHSGEWRLMSMFGAMHS